MKNKPTVIEKEDIEGNYDLKVSAGVSLPLSNLCQFCHKCIECEHPFWECPKLTELKEYAKT